MENQPERLYDLKELILISAGDQEFRKEMINLFIAQNENALAEINRNWINRDVQSIKRVLHKMKPSMMVMGVDKVVPMISKLEQLDPGNISEEEVSELLQAIGALLERVNMQLKQI